MFAILLCLFSDDLHFLSTVCGSEISTLNNSIQARAAKAERVYDAIVDEVNTILSKVKLKLSLKMP